MIISSSRLFSFIAILHTQQMVRFQATGDPGGSISAHLQRFGTGAASRPVWVDTTNTAGRRVYHRVSPSAVDRYLTAAVSEYLPYLNQPEVSSAILLASNAAGHPVEQGGWPCSPRGPPRVLGCCMQAGAAGGAPTSVWQQAHAAVLAQLSARTPQFEDGGKLYERVEGTRLMPVGCSRWATASGGLFLWLALTWLPDWAVAHALLSTSSHDLSLHCCAAWMPCWVAA